MSITTFYPKRLKQYPLIDENTAIPTVKATNLRLFYVKSFSYLISSMIDPHSRGK